jgi:hypothetical protein
MCRVAPALLVGLLVVTSAMANDAFPALDQRLGKTITVVEKNFPTEKAVITQVWRLADGSPVMQAKTLTSQVELTMVENTQAKTAAERIKLYRWVNGVRPAGCPVAPVAKTTTAPKADIAVKTTAKSDNMVKPVGYTVPVDGEKVLSVDGGLTPLLPKKEEAPVKTEVVPPATFKPTVSVPVVPQQLPVVIQSAPVQTTPVQAAPAQAAAPVKRELVGGCEVITITENGTARKYKVLGTGRDSHGVMTHRCQALDNNEIVTLNCDACGTKACAPVACTPAPVKCEPVKTVCPPVVAKTDCKPCEPAKVACDPCKTVAAPVKACDPCATAKCDPCATVKCDPCATAKCDPCASNKCGVCGGPEGSCDACSKHGRGHRVRGYRVRHDDINVPVPGVYLHAQGGVPGGPPPQPLVPAFCTMNSSAVRCYMNAPNVVPYICLHQPFGDCMNGQILAGIHTMNPGNGDAIANTMHLINVLAQSREWENRQWAAERLTQATLPTVRPYVEDALLTAAQTDRAPLVKVAAIRTLASMKSARPEVLNMLAHASVDMDPRVKEAANDVISTMMKEGMIQQAGYSR